MVMRSNSHYTDKQRLRDDLVYKRVRLNEGLGITHAAMQSLHLQAHS
jgi:hypothetical protein